MPSRTVVGVVLLLAVGLSAGCALMPAKPDARPPSPFRSDGCSLFPDGNYRVCCEAHDRAYWCGGSREQRREADLELARCVAGKGHLRLGELMRRGVRLGGVPWLPTPWRWGFGWPFGHGYTRGPQSCAGAAAD